MKTTIALLLSVISPLLFLSGCATVRLIEASKENKVEEVTSLLEGEANLDINGRNDKGSTALMLASYYGHADIVRILLVRGADINLEDNNGWTALVYAVWNRQAGIIPLLLEHGAQAEVEVFAGKTILEYAQDRKYTEIIKLLEEHILSRQ